VHRRDTLLELSILYDTARGLLRLRDRDEILSTVLLSLMGACGASRALYLARDDDDTLRLEAAEGFAEPPELSLKWTRKLETALGRGGLPYALGQFPLLGAPVARAAERQGLELVAAVAGEERILRRSRARSASSGSSRSARSFRASPMGNVTFGSCKGSRSRRR
jgi:hypothetical protein